jgi:hypothetical protein
MKDILTRKIIFEKHNKEVRMKTFLLGWWFECHPYVSDVYPYSIFYITSYNLVMFELNLRHNFLYIRNGLIWSRFDTVFGLDREQTKKITEKILKNHIEIKGIKTFGAAEDFTEKIERDLGFYQKTPVF